MQIKKIKKLIKHYAMKAYGGVDVQIQWVPEALSPGVKRSGREADHSPPTSAEIKKMWIYTNLSLAQRKAFCKYDICRCC
jgi:hypothetical protein